MVIYYFREKSVLKKSARGLLPAISWLVIVTFLFCTSGTKFPKIDWQDKILLDKWIHLFLFFILVVVWCRVYYFKDDVTTLRKIFIIVTILSIIYGVAVEFVQELFIPFRSFDPGDIIADTIGSLAGFLMAVRLYIRNRK